MKKNTYNDLVRRYNKYRNKLTRLCESGKNEHRQGVLRKHIERLFIKLQNLQLNFKRKAVLAATFTAAMTISPQNVNGQTEFYSFNPNPFSLSNVGGWSDAEFADLDGDGDMDVLAGSETGELNFLENTGTASNPSFGAPQSNPFSITTVGLDYTSPCLADLDNDGDLDLIVGSKTQLNTLTYFENTGTSSVPNFGPAQVNPFSILIMGGEHKPDFGDLDGDGDLDLMVSLVNGDVIYCENTGTISTPVFGPVQTNPFGIPVNGWKKNIDFVDLDNDGDLDVLSGAYASVFYYMENTGTVNAPTFAWNATNPLGLVSVNHNRASTATLTDLDNDGDFDLLSGNSDGKFYYSENIGSSTTPAFTNHQTNLFSIMALPEAIVDPSFGDLDNDGDLDLITGNNAGAIMYYENEGTNLVANFGLAQAQPFSLTNEGGGAHPTLVDLDDDGDLDVMMGIYNAGTLFYFENIGSNSAPNYDVAQSNPFSINGVGGASDPAFVDLDNDGDLDLLAGDYNGSFSYWENIGTASSPNFDTPQLNPFSLTNIATGHYTSPAFADLDNDGDFDLLSGGYYGNFHFYENTGTSLAPAFDAATLINPFSLTEICRQNSSPTFVDLDADGDLDLVSGDATRNLHYFDNISACSVDTGVSLAGITLSADQDNGTYQWVDCDNGNAPIAGATNQTFTPTVNGNYACEVDLTNCDDITACVEVTTIGIEEQSIGQIQLYPNPTTAHLTIDSEEQIEEILIFDLFGSLVQTENTSTFSVAKLSEGIYILNVRTNMGLSRVRFVKE